VGTSSPLSRVDVRAAPGELGRFAVTSGAGFLLIGGNASTTEGLRLTYDSGDGSSNINNFFNAALKFSTNNTERVRIDGAGNVGIGTTSVGTNNGSVGLKFGLKSAQNNIISGESSGSNFNGIILESRKTGRSVAERYAQIQMAESSNNGLISFYTAPSGSGVSERMRINSNGALCINRTDQQNDERLAVFGNVGQQCMSLKSPITTAYDMINIINGNGQVGTIQTNGSATSYNTSSDYRLKEDWQVMTGASERVKALNPVNFAWKVDGLRVDGFLAHEVAEVVPEAVSGEKDAIDAEGNPVYQGIDQSKLVPLLTAALQEALAKIESLEARLDAANI
jgi:hypothetical protein